MGKLMQVCWLALSALLIFSCGLLEKNQSYEKMAYEHLKPIIENAAVDSIMIEDSLLCINFVEPQTKEGYFAFAKENAIKFSNFRQKKIGQSGVTVYCTYKGLIYAEAIAREGEVVSIR